MADAKCSFPVKNKSSYRPKVATYDLKPEMSAFEVTGKLVDAIKSGKFDLIVANFANADMVGHTGVIEAAIKAVEAVDASSGGCAKLWSRSGDC